MLKMSSRTAKMFANLKSAAAVVQPREGGDLVQNGVDEVNQKLPAEEVSTVEHFSSCDGNKQSESEQERNQVPTTSTENFIIEKDFDLLVNSDDMLKDPNYNTESNGSNNATSDNESSDNSEENPVLNDEVSTVEKQSVRRPSRKRQRNPDSWKCNVRKRKYHSGQEYISKNKTLIQPKTLGPPCSDACRFKCSLNITPEQRRNIFKIFRNDQKKNTNSSAFLDI